MRLLLIGALVAATVSLAGPATASAARLYLAIGDSVGAGYGSTLGQSYFDLYCAYLKSPAAGSLVDQCVNDSTLGLTTQSALDGGAIQTAVNQIEASTDTPIVTVVLGGNDLLGPGCEPITGVGCDFIRNMRTILDELETALAMHRGPHVIQWLEYYNPNHDNPFGAPAEDQATAGLLLGSDLALTDCSSSELALLGLDDAINCVAKEKGATPVDAYVPFQTNCTGGDCFYDSLHPDDKGYGLIFEALRETMGSPVPATPPPDGIWPFGVSAPTLSAVAESSRVFAAASRHHRGGTVFSFRLSAPAHIRIAIERVTAGRQVGSRCRPPAAGLRDLPLCTRLILVAALSKAGLAGRDTVSFSGRVQGRPLKPGRYEARFSSASGADQSGSQTLDFRVISPRRNGVSRAPSARREIPRRP